MRQFWRLYFIRYIHYFTYFWFLSCRGSGEELVYSLNGVNPFTTAIPVLGKYLELVWNVFAVAKG